MRSPVVIDTNVGVVANGKHAAADLDCISACIEALKNARKRSVLVDDGQRIFDEYRRHLSPAGQPGAGDAFFKWLWSNQGNPRYCCQVVITELGVTGTDFGEFPDDPALATFDRDDRKFVAVAIASGQDPYILNASDTDWWIHRTALISSGVNVKFLCPELMLDEE